MSKTPELTEEMVEAGAKAAWEVREKQSGGTLTWEGVLRRREECQFTYMNACDVRDQVRAALTAALQSAADTPAPPVNDVEGAAPKRWLVEWTLPSGSTRWQVVEHEHHARTFDSGHPQNQKVTPLYEHPPAPKTKTAAFTSAEIEEAAAHCEHVASEYEARANDPNCNRDHYLRAAERKRREAAVMRPLAAVIPPSETTEDRL